MSGTHTKERILDAAEELMWSKSFHSVGLSEILKVVGVPKGSFYYYFESKEHFGVEMLKHYIKSATVDKTLALISTDTQPDPLKRLLEVFESSIARFEEKECKCPCLVLKLASEVTDFSESMREVLAEGMVVWLGILGSVFDEAKTKGLLPESVNPLLQAECVRDLWAGAIQRGTIMKSSEPMRTAHLFIREHLSALRKKPRAKQPA